MNIPNIIEYMVRPVENEIHSVLKASYVKITIPIIPHITSIARVVEESVPNNIPIMLANARGIVVSDNLGAKSLKEVFCRNISLFIIMNIPE